ncbi:hypothetical protein sscle_07g057860 [Sclerotinia sclerotiorum 1980 UF-70]|uniref:Brl1/Brr6 domain-containing protein n=1 Tax=Sclerotinia sclerotiorum (strain ATCC 18683 / 1980 / Ss-1) TaxID=665079 RepID=A0A1D9Q7Z8_SCLS1|nr:hypothetical protein sscle_07g057860 [Sclerotinia sclerotiorum 1980 UF-70]
MYGNTSRRTGEGPMDFEWQEKGGPMDPKSPFLQFNALQIENASTKPTNSFLTKSSTPAPAFRNPAFTTPRKPHTPDIYSEASGLESSPGETADAEDTPEIPKTTSKNMTTFSSHASARKPLFGKYGTNYKGTSPGARNDLRRMKLVGQPIAKKRKRQHRDEREDETMGIVRHHRKESVSETESESGDSRPNSRSNDRSQAEDKPGWFSSFLSGIESRPNLPNILSYYAQLALNTFVVGLIMFGVYSFWTTIRSDVDKASQKATAEVLSEMAHCAKQYAENRCEPSMRLPALETVCNNWEACMTMDPNSVGRARISAKTFAEILDSFIQPISYKAMIFVALILTLSIAANNMAFGMFRSKPPTFHPEPQPHPQAHLPQHPNYFGQPNPWGIPQTPQSHFGPYEPWPTGASTTQRGLFGQRNGFGNGMGNGEFEFKTIERSPSKNRGRTKGRSPSKGERRYLE